MGVGLVFVGAYSIAGVLGVKDIVKVTCVKTRLELSSESRYCYIYGVSRLAGRYPAVSYAI